MQIKGINEMSKKILICDSTLRDGNHAISHQMSKKHISNYCKIIDNSGVNIVEVGHGNGLGASSLQVGESLLTDKVMLETARENLKIAKLGIFVIPGFATIERDLKKAFDYGVDVVRVAAHCTEADITERHIQFCRENGKSVFGVLMMTHMINPSLLLEQAKKMEEYGAEGIILMDSAGNYLPHDVREKVSLLAEKLSIPVGFHSHNNLGMGIANTVTAIESGATIVDGSSRAFGAGAGNAQLEVLIAVLNRMNLISGFDLYKVLDAADYVENHIAEVIPTISSLSIVSGLSGVFSGFIKPVKRIANEFNVDARDLFFELGRRKILAGQEDIILEIASDLSKKES